MQRQNRHTKKTFFHILSNLTSANSLLFSAAKPMQTLHNPDTSDKDKCAATLYIKHGLSMALAFEPKSYSEKQLRSSTYFHPLMNLHPHL
jgi:hypothetical protein